MTITSSQPRPDTGIGRSGFGSAETRSRSGLTKRWTDNPVGRSLRTASSLSVPCQSVLVLLTASTGLCIFVSACYLWGYWMALPALVPFILLVLPMIGTSTFQPSLPGYQSVGVQEVDHFQAWCQCAVGALMTSGPCSLVVLWRGGVVPTFPMLLLMTGLIVMCYSLALLHNLINPPALDKGSEGEGV